MSASEANDSVRVVVEADWRTESAEEIHSRLVFTPDFHLNLDWNLAAVLLVKALTAVAMAEFTAGIHHVCDDLADDEEELVGMAGHLLSMTPPDLVERLGPEPWLNVSLTPMIRRNGSVSLRVGFPGSHADLGTDDVTKLALTSLRSAVHASMSNAIVEGLTALPESEGGTDVKGARTVVAHINQYLTQHLYGGTVETETQEREK